MNKKAQSGIEFLIITGIMLFFFVMFFVAINQRISVKEAEKENIVLKNLAIAIQDEINLAHSASNGYSRNFTTPLSISGKEYELRVGENLIYVKTNANALSLLVKNVTGEINKGENMIKNVEGMVYLNE